MIHLRVVSPSDVTDALVPVLRAEPAVLNLMVARSAVSGPDGDALHFDVRQTEADAVIERMRHLGVEQRGSIVLENIDASLSAADNADRGEVASPQAAVREVPGLLRRDAKRCARLG